MLKHETEAKGKVLVEVIAYRVFWEASDDVFNSWSWQGFGKGDPPHAASMSTPMSRL